MRYAQGHTTKLAAVLMAAAFDGLAEERLQPAKSGPEPPQSPFSIVVSIPDRKLALLLDGRVLKVYDVAVGKTSTPSPQGKYVLINRVSNPTWYGPQGPVAPGKNNPIGTRWMGLSVSGYGIHGTNAPASIGHAASHGCIRMRQQDLEELFDLVDIGTRVEIQNTEIRNMEELLAKVF
jgi:lipoprotein-anchoring transpeptidase ErfK/SrfK